MNRLNQLAQEHLPCTYCSAAPGEPCLASSGGRARYQHEARNYPARQFWHAGFDDGVRDAVEQPEWAKRWAEQLQ